MSDVLADPGEPSAPSGEAPAVTAEPQTPVGKGWIWTFALAWFGYWLTVMLPPQFLTPQLIETVAPEHKVDVLSFLLIEGAVVSLVCIPFAGMACDRTRSRFGRRRPWALGGLLLTGSALSLIGLQTDWRAVAALMALVAAGNAMTLVALSAVIADQVPPGQRGAASAAMGVPQVVSLAVGMVVVTMLIESMPARWAVTGLVGVVCALPFLLGRAEPPAADVPVRGTRLPIPRPRSHPDYYWALFCRVAVNAGNAAGTAYLLYFLSDVLHRPRPDEALLVLTLVYLVFCSAFGFLGGVLSDRLARRRVLVAVSGGLQALSALLLAFAPSWPAAIVAAALLGMGYGAFLSVDQALVTDVLPDRRSRARDVGIINAAQNVPIAPMLGWLVLTTVASYRVLYAVAALIMLVGSAAVYRIKGVR
ncbi:MFS transporter [Microtetraspora glauca]|uniref:MFS transporter n=1 Tax=Microtetraspora glauca TaxID=1996 RepID=A0ABV3GSP4_MICGL